MAEAGGLVMLPEGTPFDCTKGRVLCCNGEKLAKQFLDLAMYKE